MTGDAVRDEAERLVAAALAAVSLAARGLGAGSGHRAGQSGYAGFATGSPECCVCPICQVIAAMRDPSPDLAERLAAGAGDLATGVAGLLRAFGRGERHRRGSDRDGGGWPWADQQPTDPSTDPFEHDDDGVEDPWRAATAPAAARKPMAKKAIKKTVKKAAPAPTEAPTETPTEAATEQATDEPPAKKATAKKATAKKAAAKKATPTKAAAKKSGRRPAPGSGGGA